LLSLLSLATTSVCTATQYSGAGTVHTLDAADLTSYGANTNWFELNGVAGFGNCKAWNQGTMFRIRDDLRGQQMYATLMAAFLAGMPVTVYADDTYTDGNGYCYAQQVFLGQVPP
jgi:hypothetical protein